MWGTIPKLIGKNNVLRCNLTCRKAFNHVMLCVRGSCNSHLRHNRPCSNSSLPLVERVGLSKDSPVGDEADQVAGNQRPSGKCLQNYGKSPFVMRKLTISMAIFKSYVKLSEVTFFHSRKLSIVICYTAIPCCRKEKLIWGYNTIKPQST